MKGVPNLLGCAGLNPAPSTIKCHLLLIELLHQQRRFAKIFSVFLCELKNLRYICSQQLRIGTLNASNKILFIFINRTYWLVTRPNLSYKPFVFNSL